MGRIFRSLQHPRARRAQPIFMLGEYNLAILRAICGLLVLSLDPNRLSHRRSTMVGIMATSVWQFLRPAWVSSDISEFIDARDRPSGSAKRLGPFDLTQDARPKSDRQY